VIKFCVGLVVAVALLCLSVTLALWYLQRPFAVQP
jgi:hypothetical protein